MKVLIKIGKFFVFLIGLAAIILVTLIWVTYATKSGKLDFLKETGPIGDTIGGLTAPIIGLIGSLLVYYSFKAQLRANKI